MHDSHNSPNQCRTSTLIFHKLLPNDTGARLPLLREVRCCSSRCNRVCGAIAVAIAVKIFGHINGMRYRLIRAVVTIWLPRVERAFQCGAALGCCITESAHLGALLLECSKSVLLLCGTKQPQQRFN